MALRLLAKPTASEARVNIETGLSGRSYTLRFDWSERNGLWSFWLFDESGTIVANRAVRHGVPLLYGVRAATRPPGELVVLTADRSDPTLETFAEADLVYAEDPSELSGG